MSRPNYNQEKLALITLTSFPLFGPSSLKKINNFFPSWAKALEANYIDLKNIGLKEETIDQFIKFKKEKKTEKIIEIIDQENISLISQTDEDFPPLLKEIPTSPYLLYVRGRKSFNHPLLTVVGSRRTSSYGLNITNQLIKQINQKINIVSGLAKGIDTAAHWAAIKSNKKTIAILGSGIDKKSIYPQENKFLAEKIIDSGGCLLSEFPPFTPPLKNHFPRRNRLLAGLSPATLVIEAGQKSGALITASLALDFNREVLAVPDNLFSSYSQGSNYLLKSGATVILKFEDIEEALNIDSLKINSTLNLRYN